MTTEQTYKVRAFTEADEDKHLPAFCICWVCGESARLVLDLPNEHFYYPCSEEHAIQLVMKERCAEFSAALT